MRNLWDIQSVSYLVLYVALIAWQWTNGVSVLAYGALFFFTIGLQIIHHNHVHLGIWKSKLANRATDYLISTLTAVPSAMMVNGHIGNHHVHHHGPDDVTRTYRFGGDHNHALGYLLHPFQAFFVLIPMFWRQFLAGWPKRNRFSKDIFWQTVLIFTSWSLLALAGWKEFLLLVIVPQAFGLHWLLGANYLQHAHCDDASEDGFARNFTGAINWPWLNIGFHTAHHHHPKVHWSKLKKLHNETCQNLPDQLNQPSFVAYVVKTFMLSPFFDSCRSETLRSKLSVERD